MTTRVSLCFAALSLAATAPRASGQPATSTTSSVFYLPTAVHAPGLFGSYFKTHVAFYNPTSSAFTVHVTLFDTNGSPHLATFALQPNQTMAYADFVDEVFHYTGAGAVRFDSGSTANQMALSAEVYTNGACGDFGTDVPAVASTLSPAESVSPGVTNDGSQRTNLACFNGGAGANQVVAQVFDEANNVVQTVTIDLAKDAWKQLPVTAFVEGGYVRFHPSAPAYCYAVVVTNTTNDGRFIPAQVLSF